MRVKAVSPGLEERRETALTANAENTVEMSCAIYYCEGRYDNLPRSVPLWGTSRPSVSVVREGGHDVETD